MSDNALKTPFSRSLPEAIGKGANDAAQLAGKVWPCSVVARIDRATVRVKFEVDTAPFTPPQLVVPILAWRFITAPIPVGTKGLLIPADVYTQHLTGMGGSGTPNLTRPANLGALHFLPLADKAWPAVEDGALVLYGVTKAIIRDSEDGDASLTLTATEATLAFGDDAKVKVSDSRVDIDGDLYINGKKYVEHAHGGVMSGGDTSAGVADP